MRYVEFRDAIEKELRRRPEGLTWRQLQERLSLPYDRPCSAWTKQLEQEIGLSRMKSAGRALLWRVAKAERGE
jgi:hypothetical protein